MPTRITSRSATLIDHIYYYRGNNNKHNMKPKSGNLLNDITDHLPNYLLVLRNKTFPLVERPLVRVFSKQNKQNFYQELSLID